MKFKVFKHIPLLVLVALLLATACKKETAYTPYPYNRILSFGVDTGGTQTIGAAVAGDSLVIYWPTWLAKPATITPVIEVSENATISPASGEQVTFATGTAYTVKAQDGTTKKYYLKVIDDQPMIVLTESNYYTQKGLAFTWEIERGILRNIIPDADKTRFWMIDSTGREYQLNINFPAEHPGYNVAVVAVTLPDEMPVGHYKLKIESGVRTKMSDNAFFALQYRNTAFAALSGTVTVARGGLLTLKGNTAFTPDIMVSLKNVIVSRRLNTSTSNPLYEDLGVMEIDSYSGNELKVRFAADLLPAGNYPLVSYTLGAIVFRLNWNPFSAAAGWDYTQPYKTAITNLSRSGSPILQVTD